MSVRGSRWYPLGNTVFDRNFGGARDLTSTHPGVLTSHNGLGETAFHSLAAEDDLEEIVGLHEKGSDLDAKINSKRQCGSQLLNWDARSQYSDHRLIQPRYG